MVCKILHIIPHYPLTHYFSLYNLVKYNFQFDIIGIDYLRVLFMGMPLPSNFSNEFASLETVRRSLIGCIERSNFKYPNS